MRHTRSLALLAGGLLALTACGDGDDADTEAEAGNERIDAVEAQTVDLEAQVEDLQGQIDQLQEELDQAAEPDTSADEDQDDPVDEVDQDAGSDSDDGSDAGATALGDSADFHDLLTDEYLGTVTVNEVYPNFECPRDNDWEAESGAFMAVDVTVEADGNASDAPRVYDSAFYLQDEDNEIHDPVAGNPATNACVDDSELLPESRPGGTSNGLVILDVNVDAGSLVLDSAADRASWDF